MSSAPTTPGDDRLTALERDVGQIKVDLAGVKARLDAEFPALRRELDAQFPALRRELASKADLAAVRTEIAGIGIELQRMVRQLIQWSLGTLIALAGVAAAAAGILVAVLR